MRALVYHGDGSGEVENRHPESHERDRRIDHAREDEPREPGGGGEIGRASSRTEKGGEERTRLEFGNEQVIVRRADDRGEDRGEVTEEKEEDGPYEVT